VLGKQRRQQASVQQSDIQFFGTGPTRSVHPFFVFLFSPSRSHRTAGAGPRGRGAEVRSHRPERGLRPSRISSYVHSDSSSTRRYAG